MNKSFLFRDIPVGKFIKGILIVVAVFVGWRMWPDKHLGDDYYVNKNGQVYLNGDGFVYGDDILVGVDAKTFTIIVDHAYIKDKNAVFAVLRNGANRWVSRVNGADMPSFVGAGGSFGKDKSRVFFEDRVVYGAYPTSFAVVGNDGYAKDKEHVFFEDKIISNRPNLLRLILPPDTGYFSGQGITGGFYYYATDDERIFLNGNEVKGSDPTTFEVPFRGFPELARDSHSIYFKGAKVEGVDSESFVVFYASNALDMGYAKDRNHVYFSGYDYGSNLCLDKLCIVEAADPKTFSLNEAGGGYDAKDASHYFSNGAVANER